MTKQRPKHLALHEIRLPLAGFASILHRISGAGLFLMLPLLIWLLQLSLGSTQQNVDMFHAVTGNWLVKLILLGLIWAFLHHFCMGIRILLIDIHVGVEKQQAHSSAVAVMAISLALTAIFGLKLLGAF
ncbi:MAG: succinate dehydrogenase, cytochrome b556 subunit [Sulfuritalea sp.]|nr:succinate dehydrogenase, cytochrome b556 subunit [Sulfuritalea sp.]